jgi:hypothetical protein
VRSSNLRTRLLRAHLVAVGDSSAWVLTAGEFIEVLCGKTTLDGGIASSAVSAMIRLTPAWASWGMMSV